MEKQLDIGDEEVFLGSGDCRARHAMANWVDKAHSIELD